MGLDSAARMAGYSGRGRRVQRSRQLSTASGLASPHVGQNRRFGRFGGGTAVALSGDGRARGGVQRSRSMGYSGRALGVQRSRQKRCRPRRAAVFWRAPRLLQPLIFT